MPDWLNTLRRQFNDRVGIAETRPGVYQLLTNVIDKQFTDLEGFKRGGVEYLERERAKRGGSARSSPLMLAMSLDSLQLEPNDRDPQVVDTPPEEVVAAGALFRARKALSVPYCFFIYHAKARSGIALSGASA